jgi:hypothetical protein
VSNCVDLPAQRLSMVDVRRRRIDDGHQAIPCRAGMGGSAEQQIDRFRR